LKVDAVIFDLFETLVLMRNNEEFYPNALEKLHQSLLKNGLNIPNIGFNRVYFEVRDKFYATSMQSLKEPHFNLRITETLKKFGYNFQSDDPIVRKATDAFSEEFTRFAFLDEDAIAVLRQLHLDYKLGIISNLAIPEAGRKLLKGFGLIDFFDVIVISGEINRRKPSKEIFEKALLDLRVEASQSVFVGDTFDIDIKGAKNAGMKAILINRKPQTLGSYVWRPPDTVRIGEPDKVINKLTELIPVLRDC
jgi:putative hydrolase of the HAD superfamily